MNPETTLLTPEERDELSLTVVVRHRLEEHFESLEHQHESATLGMWIFLATEVMFFGSLFLALGTYRHLYPRAFELASERLTWQIGAVNTLVLLTSSLTMVLAVHHARHGPTHLVPRYLAATVVLGLVFLGLKAVEYWIDYREMLIPGWRFDEAEWVAAGLPVEQVGNAQLFLLFYWVMTLLHALHMILGIGAVSVLWWLARRGVFSQTYYSPIDVVGLYWHFVDVVWIFLLPMLYLLGTHHHV